MKYLGSTSLTVFTGPMFSAKTKRLLAELERFGYAQSRILVMKPAQDTRTNGSIASRKITGDGHSVITEKIDAVPIASIEEFREFTAGTDYDVLAVDEAQFFPLDSPIQDSLGWFGREIRSLLHRRKDTSLQVFIAGLDTDSDDMPFGPMPGLLSLADRVEKLAAVCMACSHITARKSQNCEGSTAAIRVGDFGLYEARCRACFSPIV